MKKTITAILIISVLIIVTACNEQVDEDLIIEEFNNIIDVKQAGFNDVLAFMRENIGDLSEEKASLMLLKFEDYHKDYISIIEDCFFIDTIQSHVQQEYYNGQVDINNPEIIKDKLIKALVVETIKCGYKVAEAEAQFFPIIDYSFYQEFSTYAEADIEEYFRIMKTESDQLALKDAAPVISWDEVINRALVIEEFLLKYQESEKAETMGELYERYKVLTFFGSPNSPIFDQNQGVLKDKVKKAYQQAVNTANEIEYINILKDFNNILKKTNYRLSIEVDEYRNSII
jgi:hypothetical protein